MKQDAFDNFYAEQTPANAVALAYADHRAGAWSADFLEALAKAEKQLLAHGDLVLAIKALLRGEKDLAVIRQAHAALFKAEAL